MRKNGIILMFQGRCLDNHNHNQIQRALHVLHPYTLIIFVLVNMNPYTISGFVLLVLLVLLAKQAQAQAHAQAQALSYFSFGRVGSQ